ncbi:MAG: hypothetical protein V4857_00590 [Pseudomonadota bacterium]
MAVNTSAPEISTEIDCAPGALLLLPARWIESKRGHGSFLALQTSSAHQRSHPLQGVINKSLFQFRERGLRARYAAWAGEKIFVRIDTLLRLRTMERYVHAKLK